MAEEIDHQPEAQPANGHADAGQDAPSASDAGSVTQAAEPDEVAAANGHPEPPLSPPRPDLGEVFERVLALSLTIGHPAYSRAREGFAEDGRVYLVYPDERLTPFAAQGHGSVAMPEHEALSVAIQICQAVSYLHNRGMRVNDICPASLAYGVDGRVKLTSLDYISNDNELQSDPILNDGYTAPEIYRGKSVDKRADVFSIGMPVVHLPDRRADRMRNLARGVRSNPILSAARHLAGAGKGAAPGAGLQTGGSLAGRRSVQGRTAQAQLAPGDPFGMSDPRRNRARANEDSVMALEFVQDSQIAPGCHYLYVVSDGMGGAEAGETASAIAVETIQDYVEKGVSQLSVSPHTQSAGAARNRGGVAHLRRAQPVSRRGSLEQVLQAVLGRSQSQNRRVSDGPSGTARHGSDSGGR